MPKFCKPKSKSFCLMKSFFSLAIFSVIAFMVLLFMQDNIDVPFYDGLMKGCLGTFILSAIFAIGTGFCIGIRGGRNHAHKALATTEPTPAGGKKDLEIVQDEKSAPRQIAAVVVVAQKYKYELLKEPEPAELSSLSLNPKSRLSA